MGLFWRQLGPLKTRHGQKRKSGKRGSGKRGTEMHAFLFMFIKS